MRLITAYACLLFLATANAAMGHGTPIQVQANTALIVSGGTSDSDGFAPMMFRETDDDGDPFATTTLPSVGPVVAWQIPGFEINGLDPTASLTIEVLSRPVNNALPVQTRTLWYWNPATGEVEPTAAPLYLLGSGQRVATIDPALSAPPAPFLLVNQVGGTAAQGGQQGFHNHALLSYALDNDFSPPAANGAYGFFARLTSNGYASSDPYLVVLNRGVDYDQMAEAALAINAAAFLPGDFNHDNRVDAADYVVWRDTDNSPENYALWRVAFGATYPPIGGSASGVAGTTIVPEPSMVAILAGIVTTCTIKCRHKRFSKR